MKKFYLTTAIVYVNSPPHIGFAYEVIAADVLARFRRLLGEDVFFLTGSDEHSINVEKKAASEGLSPQEYCDRMVDIYKKVWRGLNISYDDFIRTTDERHIKTTQKLVKYLEERGDIYQGVYEGWYCVSCEAFYRQKDLAEGKCPVHDIEPQWLQEDNYFFALSRYQDSLLEYLGEHPDFIHPESRRNEIINIVKEGLTDVSISRAGLKWGIPYPGDENHVVYVWFDALVNYISAIGFGQDSERFAYYWPADVHTIGKDITRFHCIIWPAMLMAAGLDLPGKVFSHGFVSIQGAKISKTRGNIVDPQSLVDQYGVDTIRYFLLREIPFGSDGDFSEEALINRINSDLANDLGNLLSRSLAMVEKYSAGIVPSDGVGDDSTVDGELKMLAQEIPAVVERQIEALTFSEALISIWKLIKRANRYIEENRPWDLAKRESGKKQLATVLYNLVEVIRITTILISPFMPETAQKMWQQLGIETGLSQQRLSDASHWGGLESGTSIARGEALFPRI